MIATLQLPVINRLFGAMLLTVKDANDFLDRFAHHKPPQKLLTELHNIVAKEAGVIEQRKMNILEYFLDISAACVEHHPYGIREIIRYDDKQKSCPNIGRLFISRCLTMSL
ncbi:hypothetical protein BMETH_422_3 [methanotrophic bacterial endosymbiont of Bathymodiolus sp.]|nr:hypothetical protein BMETH_422_3 [methanotrophic bacterial endosymbiont of Bathymodiolus sp.]